MHSLAGVHSMVDSTGMLDGDVPQPVRVKHGISSEGTSMSLSGNNYSVPTECAIVETSMTQASPYSTVVSHPNAVSYDNTLLLRTEALPYDTALSRSNTSVYDTMLLHTNASTTKKERAKGFSCAQHNVVRCSTVQNTQTDYTLQLQLRCYAPRASSTFFASTTGKETPAAYFGKDTLKRIWQRIEDEQLRRIVFYDGGVRSCDDLAHLIAPERAWAYCYELAGEPLAFFWCNGFAGRAAQMHFCVFQAGMSRRHELGVMATHFLLGIERTPPTTSKPPFSQKAQNAEGMSFASDDMVPYSLLNDEAYSIMQDNESHSPMLDKEYHSFVLNDVNTVSATSLQDTARRGSPFILPHASLCSSSWAPLDTLIGVTPACFRHALHFAQQVGFVVLGKVPSACYLAPSPHQRRTKGRYVPAVLSLCTRESSGCALSNDAQLP